MANLKHLRVDSELALRGIWVPYLMDIELLIARAGTIEYDKTIRELTRPQLLIYRTNLPQDVIDSITCTAMARHCLLGWRNIDADVEPVLEADKLPEKSYRELPDKTWQETVTYSQEEAQKLLSDPTLYDLFRFVLSVANDASIYRSKRQKASLGNS